MVSRPSEKVAAIFRWLLNNADIIFLTAIGLGAILILTGCSAPKIDGAGSFFGMPVKLPDGLVTKGEVGAALQPLVWTGGLCIPVGIVVLFITKLERGWIFIGFGIGLCILSWFLAMLQAWIMLVVAPVIIVVVLYYAWTMFRKLRDNGGVLSHWRKGAKKWQQSDGQSSPVSPEAPPSGSSSPS